MRRKHRRLERNAELDITAFLNLMIVLVPVLLINLVFAQTSVLDLNFPESSGGNNSEENLQLQVILLENQIILADNKGGVIKQLPKLEDGEHDYALLALVAKDIKARLPEKRDITIMPKDETSYQTLVTTMDTLRSYKTVVGGHVVNAELFPDISIADAPEIIDPASSAGAAP